LKVTSFWKLLWWFYPNSDLCDLIAIHDHFTTINNTNNLFEMQPETNLHKTHVTARGSFSQVHQNWNHFICSFIYFSIIKTVTIIAVWRIKFIILFQSIQKL